MALHIFLEPQIEKLSNLSFVQEITPLLVIFAVKSSSIHQNITLGFLENNIPHNSHLLREPTQLSLHYLLLLQVRIKPITKPTNVIRLIIAPNLNDKGL